MLEITLYTKENCSLCLKAKRILLDVQRRQPFRLSEVDITTSEELHERYRYDIPVATVNGEEIFRHRVQADTLEQELIKRSKSI